MAQHCAEGGLLLSDFRQRSRELSVVDDLSATTGDNVASRLSSGHMSPVAGVGTGVGVTIGVEVAVAVAVAVAVVATAVHRLPQYN